MKSESHTQAVEDYLKIIYMLTEHDKRAATTQIAEALNIKPASATGMIQKLAASNPPLVEYQKYQGVKLTPAGEKAALEILRHHRLLERFLHETLGFPWDEVHEEACTLEHFISDNFEDRMADVLGNPSHDPHGDPIPTRDLQMPDLQTVPLADLKTGQKAIIRRVKDTNPDLLRYLGNLFVVPDAEIEIKDHTPFDNNLKIKIIGKEGSIVLGPDITNQIFVQILE